MDYLKKSMDACLPSFLKRTVEDAVGGIVRPGKSFLEGSDKVVGLSSVPTSTASNALGSGTDFSLEAMHAAMDAVLAMMPKQEEIPAGMWAGYSAMMSIKREVQSQDVLTYRGTGMYGLFGGIPIHEDPELEPDMIEFRNAKGDVLRRMRFGAK